MYKSRKTLLGSMIFLALMMLFAGGVKSIVAKEPDFQSSMSAETMASVAIEDKEKKGCYL